MAYKKYISIITFCRVKVLALQKVIILPILVCLISSELLIAQNNQVIIQSGSGSEIPVAGTSSMNYIKTITYREPHASVPASGFKHIEEIQYIDGLGRPVQVVQAGASPKGNDIIQPVLYDTFGREAIKTLPYTDNKSGAFRTGVSEAAVSSYYNSETLIGKEKDGRAFTLTGYDNSPLNRVISQTGPGTAWEAKPVTINFLTNTSAKPGWVVSGSYSYSSLPFEAFSLYVIETIDEGGTATREYKDKPGRVVLKESKFGGEWLQTFYIYDDFGLLRCVVPPEASGPADTDLCYYYLYDSRKRMIEKKIPGGGTVRMVYDKRDRLRFTRNSNQASVNEWSYTKYDELNRPVISGILNNYTSSAAALETAINSATLNEVRNNSQTSGYSNISYPVTNATVLSVTYYDDYSFFEISGNPVSKNLKSGEYDNGDYNIQNLLAASNKGRITGTMTMVLSDAGDASSVLKNRLYSTFYYDKYGNLLRSVSDNHLGGTDVITNLYEDLTFQVIQSKQEHYTWEEQITLEKWFEYDHAGRLLATREKINDQPELTVNAMQYNELGEMVTKYLHSGQTSGTLSFLQKTDYLYNIRGWLTKINDPGLGDGNDLFGMQLFYNSTAGMGGLAAGEGLYNGNISGIKWGIKNEAIRGYRFTYDDLNRILQANYAEGSALGSNTGFFSESISKYDKNGNILGLLRKHNDILVDNLEYKYFPKANRLQRITDSGTASSEIDDYPGSGLDYSYDTNGNMICDGAKNLSIKYNSTLNLPQELDFGSNNRIFYHYTAGGAKLIKHSIPSEGTGTLTHYTGNVIYEGSTLSYILTDEGRIIADGTGADRKFLYEYNLKDHLGNTRVTFTGNDSGGSADVVQTTNYYPFGLVMSQTNSSTSPGYRNNKYLYNGKELQDDVFAGSSLNWYDYGHRFYDPQIGRFISLDPMAEFFPYMTCYQYASNNPVKNIDLDGLEGIIFTLGVSDPILLSSKPTLIEGLTKAGGEIGGKAIKASKTARTGNAKPMPTEALKAGRQTEVEQLFKNGLEKNNQSITKVDPKTSKEGTTIPDALKNGGKSSVEIKNVGKQSLTEQLRLQEKFSNDNGFKPELIINEGAKLSKPLQGSSFDITTYSSIPAVQDNTKVVMPLPLKVLQIQNENQQK